MIYSFRPFCVAMVLLAAAAHGAEYEVGPGRPLGGVGEVPWESLEPGDRVLIHARPEPYRSKFVLCRRGTEDRPIVVRGVPGPNGELPVIDGRDATTRPELNYWNEARGLIKIGGANRPADAMPAHLVIENLELRSARPPFAFTGRDGPTDYTENAAALFIEKGEHITIRNCTLRDSGNGLFIASQTTDVLIEGCRIEGNGIEDSIYHHNAYTEALGLTYHGNHFGPLRDGCPGNNLKDRSAGLVVRYNRIEGGNRQLDLVDAGSADRLVDHPRYRRTFVYGNVLIEPDGHGNSQIVHYGGDSDNTDAYRKGTLYFHHNTVISQRTGTTTLLRLSTEAERADCRNNIVYLSEAPGSRLALLTSAGTLHLSRNYLPTGYVPSHGDLTGAIHDDRSSITASAPGFVDPNAGDYHLAPGSPCIDAGGPLPDPALPDHTPRRQYTPPASTEPRSEQGPADLGAFEFNS